jgi:multimeric flavodoxin WrbA
MALGYRVYWMKALIINCSLKNEPDTSNTQALANALAEELDRRDVEVHSLRAVDLNILPGVTSDEGSEDDWPKIRKEILGTEILILASPTWVGRMSSLAQRVLERLNGMFGEKDEQGRPVAYNHVAGFVATGNSDGAKHVIAEMIAGLSEIGFTVPGQSWAYVNNGSAAGPVYTEAAPAKQQRSKDMAAIAASNLVAVAKALKEKPISKPPENLGV